METPHITYRGMEHSPALDARIRDHIAKLEELHPKLTRCHVVVNESDRHRSKGNLFEVRIDAHVPGHEIVATHQHHEDPHTAVNNAFDVVTRQLEENIRQVRGQVKHHSEDRGDNARP